MHIRNDAATINPIETIEFDPRSRDEIPKLLMGLQEIYCNRKVRDEEFTVLRDLIPEDIDQFIDIAM